MTLSITTIVQGIGQWIADLFETIVEFFNTCYSVITSIFENINDFLDMLAAGKQQIVAINAGLPQWFSLMFVSTVAISIAYQILGRNQ